VGREVCHELGHSFGRKHRTSGRTCMRDGFTTMYGTPDRHDAALGRIDRRP
jgi:predicted Zn-dependent protease